MFVEEVKIKLNSILDVKEFVRIVSTFDCDVDLVSERYLIDGKSIMGIFSLDLSNPITMVVRTEDEKIYNEVKSQVSKFIYN